MTGIPLFIAEPTGTCRLALRRYRSRNEPSDHLHDATVVIDEDAPVTPPEPDGTRPITDKRIPRDDPRWPAACACGEPFAADDQWQVNEQEWYEGGGQRFTWGVGSWNGPPGAMIRSEWRDQPGRPESWVIFLPNRTWWNTNDRASDPLPGGNKLGPYWVVTGTAPLLTVKPSIDDRGSRPWHGWITDGVMRPA